MFAKKAKIVITSYEKQLLRPSESYETKKYTVVAGKIINLEHHIQITVRNIRDHEIDLIVKGLHISPNQWKDIKGQNGNIVLEEGKPIKFLFDGVISDTYFDYTIKLKPKRFRLRK